MIPADDTIVAISSPPGRGAIAVVRMSGKEAHAIARRCLSSWPSTPRTTRLAEVRDPSSGSIVDRAVIVRYDTPESYTGEDMVEVSGHGGLLSPAAVVAALIRAGARLAEPGEFTQRAVLNGKLDLVQAEGVMEVVDAPTEAARRNALHQVHGALSGAIETLRDEVLQLEALLAYEIDFPEEDDGPIDPARIDAAVVAIRGRLSDLVRTGKLGEMTRSGAMVVLAGPANVGKSSLFNAILGVERAIVHSSPGTTRDAIEAVVEAGRWPLRLVDTAGLRESEDEVEQTGVAISHRYLASAHLVLACGSDSAALDASIRAVSAATSAPVVAVRTKCDLGAGDLNAGQNQPTPVSAHTRYGLSELIDAIELALDRSYGTLEPHMPILTRARHQSGLETADAELAAFQDARRNATLPTAIAAVHVRSAAHALESLTGGFDVEEIFSRVFSSFCVGK